MKKADNFDATKWLVENKITTQSKLNEGIVSAPLTNMLWKLNPKVKEWENVSSTKEALSFIKSLTNEELNNLYVWRLGFDIPQSEDKKIQNLLDLINNKITEELSADKFPEMSKLINTSDKQFMIKAAESMMKKLTDEGYKVPEIREFFTKLIASVVICGAVVS
jgi:histone acetyltransferase (RNA polymerase elongator complex component)